MAVDADASTEKLNEPDERQPHDHAVTAHDIDDGDTENDADLVENVGARTGVRLALRQLFIQVARQGALNLTTTRSNRQLPSTSAMTAQKDRLMIRSLRPAPLAMPIVATVVVGAALTMPTAHADNKRLNDGVVASVYTIQHQAGCTNDVKINPQLQLAAQRHTVDVLNNRTLDGDTGSDGSSPQDRANTAGFHGNVAETVAINPALAISGIELIKQWYYNPADLAVMQNCAYAAIGVWSENSPDRTVVVAVYGQPNGPHAPTQGVSSGSPPAVVPEREVQGFDPNPDYDASDELEFGADWYAWILRGVYPPAAYPPN